VTENKTILSVKGLTVSFANDGCTFFAVDDVGFSVSVGRVFAIVGESGSGKTTTALAIMRLLPEQGRISSGQVIFEDRNLLNLAEKQMCRIRGNKIAMIFQEPAAALNPVLNVGSQIAEALMLHRGMELEQAWSQAIEMLRIVEISEPQMWADCYPHQLSGGMQQRVMIAMAISCQPSLLIADEPTTALDATVQLQILNLLDKLRHSYNMGILLVLHDLRLAARYTDDIAVMYASRIVEIGESGKVFSEPCHPYTQGLIKCLQKTGTAGKRIMTIHGTIPDPLCYPIGCKFHPRCPIGLNDMLCRTQEPRLRETVSGRWVACWYAQGYEKPGS
jgi:oligopeptide/dipeptide ABC transporter ATP-binding protein